MRKIGLMVCLVLLTTSGLAQKREERKPRKDTVELSSDSWKYISKMVCLFPRYEYKKLINVKGGGIVIKNREELMNVYEILKPQNTYSKMAELCTLGRFMDQVNFSKEWIVGYPYNELGICEPGPIEKIFLVQRNRKEVEILIFIHCNKPKGDAFPIRCLSFEWKSIPIINPLQKVSFVVTKK